jgi:lipoate-protein ligase A
MRLLDLTLSTPAENLALDEALLENAEAGLGASEVLRLWESPDPVVVIGRSSRIADEVDLVQCRQKSIPVLRRCSGGAAIVAGPGCLMYSVVLSYEKYPALRSLEQAHRFVLGKVGQAIATLIENVEMLGTSDLTVNDRKFSGNSLRCKRDHLLYHGTILYSFPLDLIAECLGNAPRQPDYRRQRNHSDFVDNLPVSAEQLRLALCTAWAADEEITDWPRETVEQLVDQRYSTESWNNRL